MNKKWGILELLRYSRHDWLNKIQLIKGNLELGKPDEVKAIIDQLVNDAKNEAELSNLNMPKMAEFLITGNWKSFPFILDYEILNVSKGCHFIDEYVYNWTVKFINKLIPLLDSFGENELKITIYGSGNHIRFTYDLQGKLKEEKEMALFLKNSPSLAVLSIISFTEAELVFDLVCPCQTFL